MTRVCVYVDGFNLYYRALRHSQYKWLNIEALAKRLLDPADTIQLVRYFTARVSPRAGDPDAPRRQQIYISALNTLPTTKIHYGRFLTKHKTRPLVSNPSTYVKVHDTEEKGSDVNLTMYLLNDGWQGLYDVALVLSQDTDLVEPIRFVANQPGKLIGVVWLDGMQPGQRFTNAASFIRHVAQSDLAASQFPPVINKPGGRKIHKPSTW